MTDDKKLPVTQTTRVTPQQRDEYLTSPVRGRSLLGRVASRFVAGLNTKTIKANTEEVQALTEYGRAKGELADTMLRAERKIANYVNHRDDIIADDHEAHLDQLQENKHQRELKQRTREETLRALDAQTEQGAVQRDYDGKIAVENNEAALAQAKWRAARARWGHEAFEQSMPFRKERIEHLYKTGALDAEIERLISEVSRDQQRRETAPHAPTSANGAALSTVEQLLAELDQEIEAAHATHASDDHKAALYGFRARLTAKAAQLKGQ